MDQERICQVLDQRASDLCVWKLWVEGAILPLPDVFLTILHVHPAWYDLILKPIDDPNANLHSGENSGN